MRKIKKLIRNVKIFYQHKDRIKDIQNEIKEELGSIHFQFASFGGADINYYVLRNNKKFGMLRLAIANKVDKENIAIIRLNKQKRLNKEYQAYSLGSKHSLTPAVLYYTTDALVCEYLEGERVFDILQKDKSKVWDILISSIKIYHNLHKLGITHLDATLKNFIWIEGQMKVIDFEYYAADNFTIEEQKAYDYVRIIEHTLRAIPMKYQNDYQKCIEVLDEVVPEEVKSVNFVQVAQWLKNIENYPIYPMLKKRIFKQLEFNTLGKK